MVWGAIAGMAARRFAPQAAAKAAEWGVAKYAGAKAANYVTSEAGQALLTKAVGPKVANFVTTKSGQQFSKRLVASEVRNVIGPSGKGQGKDKTIYAPGTEQTTTSYSYPGPQGRRAAFGQGQGAFQQNWQQIGYQAGQRAGRGGGGGGSGTPVWKRPNLEGIGGVAPGHDWRQMKFAEIQRGKTGKRPLIAEGKGKDWLRGASSGFMQQYAENLGTETRTSFSMPMSDLLPKGIEPAPKAFGELGPGTKIAGPPTGYAPGTRSVSPTGTVSEGPMGGNWAMSANERNRRQEFANGATNGINPKRRMELANELSAAAKLI